MLDWLLQSKFDTQVAAAVWSTTGAVLTTVVLFVYTLGLRFAKIIGNRRRQLLVRNWRNIFSAAIISAEGRELKLLPRIKHYQQTDLLEEWNRARTIVAGSAADNLITVGARIGLPGLARKLLQQRRLSNKLLAVQTLGHLRDQQSWAAIEDLLDSPNSVLSITAAVALVDIDAARAIRRLIPMISIRRDWLRTRVALFLRMAGSDIISEPLYRAIRSEDASGQIHLLQFAQLAESAVTDALAADLIRSSRDPGVLAAALGLLSGHDGIPRVSALARHDTWFVRLRVAQILGRVGQEKHLPLLESLLQDREWWVRYRAAQSITSLPFLGPSALRQLRTRQSDPFARDILKQAAVEVGLS